jgi:putative acetyltransferase
MEIRQARGDEEMEAARGLFRDYAAELNLDLCFQGFAEELATLPGEYAPPDGRLLLVWIEDRPRGCVALRKLSKDLCEMKRLYLNPEFRRSGRGRALTLTLLREAKAIGYRRMRLETLPIMKAAVEMYHSLGFRPIAPYPHPPIEEVMHLELGLDTLTSRGAARSPR